MPGRRFFLSLGASVEANFWGETTRTAVSFFANVNRCSLSYRCTRLGSCDIWQPTSVRPTGWRRPTRRAWVTLALRPAKQSQAGAAAIDEEGGLVHAVARSFVHKRRAQDGWPDEWVVAHAHDRSP